MLTTAGLRRSTTSAKFTTAGGPSAERITAGAAAGDRVPESAGAGVSEPATIRPTRNEPEATSRTVTRAKRRLIVPL